MGTHPIFESDFDCLTVFRNRMLVLRCSRMLAPRARLAAPGAAFYSSKNQIPESNQFWMRHQIKSKDGFHKHINFERIVAGILKKLWLVFCVVMFAAFVELNLRVGEHQGV